MPDRIHVRNDNVRRARRRLKDLQHQYAIGNIELEPLVQRLQSWEAISRMTTPIRLRQKAIERHTLTRHEEEE